MALCPQPRVFSSQKCLVTHNKHTHHNCRLTGRHPPALHGILLYPIPDTLTGCTVIYIVCDTRVCCPVIKKNIKTQNRLGLRLILPLEGLFGDGRRHRARARRHQPVEQFLPAHCWRPRSRLRRSLWCGSTCRSMCAGSFWRGGWRGGMARGPCHCKM